MPFYVIYCFIPWQMLLSRWLWQIFSHILADVIAIGVWDDINTHSYDLMLTTLADVDANFLSVVDVETTIF